MTPIVLGLVLGAAIGLFRRGRVLLPAWVGGSTWRTPTLRLRKRSDALCGLDLCGTSVGCDSPPQVFLRRNRMTLGRCDGMEVATVASLMNPLRICLIYVFVCSGCRGVPSADGLTAQRERQVLVQETNAMIDSVGARLTERDLAASIASEHLALLDHRAEKLRARCEAMSAGDRVALDPHLSWLAQVRNTTALSIGVLRNESRDLAESQAEVLLWTKVFVGEIDSLERRVDRIAPVKVLISQRPVR